jgi:hypothetical protein
MSKTILLLSALFIFNSCRGTNKTADSSSEVIQKKETTQVEVLESAQAQSITETKTADANKEEAITNEESQTVETTETIANEIMETFNHSLWSDLLQKHVSNNGNVNYKGFKADESELKIYFQSLSDNIPQDSWTKAEKLTYWINTYNAYTVKLILDEYPIESIKDISGPWDKRFIKLAKESYTLNDIEHKILRKMNEPRIHFAIVCASISCPKLQNVAFESSKLESQLTNATKEFLTDPERNILTENDIKISKIFKWFSSDFKQNGSLIDFLNKYSDITISQDADKSYKDYDWNLNE